MFKFGIIIAVEFDELSKIYGIDKIEKKGCYKVFQIEEGNNQLIFIASGPGEIQAAAATQYMIDNYEPDMLINFGLAGGLTGTMKVKDMCIVKSVVHTDYNVSLYEKSEEDNLSKSNGGIKPGQYPGLKGEKILLDQKLAKRFYIELEKISEAGTASMVSCASQDRIVISEEKRQGLGKAWECQICDMELAGIGLVALKNKVPLVSVKVVSDTVGDGYDSLEEWEGKFLQNFKAFAALLRVCEN